MSAIDVALPLIKEFEGYAKRLANDWCIAYQDMVGEWTIGYGSTGPDIKQGTYWTRERADADLSSRLIVLQHEVIEASPILSRPENENRLAAVLSFSYNLGFGRYLASTLKRKIDAQQWTDAAAEFAKWDLAGGRKVAGLVARRAAEQALFLTAASAPAATPQTAVQSDVPAADSADALPSLLARLFSWIIGKIKH